MKPFITIIEEKLKNSQKGNKITIFECKICGQRFFMLRKAREHVLRLHSIPAGESSCNKIKAYMEVI